MVQFRAAIKIKLQKSFKFCGRVQLRIQESRSEFIVRQFSNECVALSRSWMLLDSIGSVLFVFLIPNINSLVGFMVAKV